MTHGSIQSIKVVMNKNAADLRGNMVTIQPSINFRPITTTAKTEDLGGRAQEPMEAAMTQQASSPVWSQLSHLQSWH